MKMRIATLSALMGLCGLLCLMPLSTALSAQAPQQKPGVSLEQKVEQLEKRVAELQKEVEALKERPVVLTTSAQPGVTFGLPLVPGPNVPSDWTPFQFNGMTYYLIPLDNSASGARLQLAQPK